MRDGGTAVPKQRKLPQQPGGFQKGWGTAGNKGNGWGSGATGLLPVKQNKKGAMVATGGRGRIREKPKTEKISVGSADRGGD